MRAIEPANGREVTDEHKRQWKQQVSAPYKNRAQGLLRLRFGKNHEQNGDVAEFLEPPLKGSRRENSPKGR